ncbi:MAG: sigma factor, partial [Dokdonella sp.]
MDTPRSEPEDAELVRRASAGDVRAFEALYRRHSGRVHGAVWRLSGMNPSRAEELTQEAFVRAWQKLGSFRFESAFTTWLHRLAVNVALMDLRS